MTKATGRVGYLAGLCLLVLASSGCGDDGSIDNDGPPTLIITSPSPGAELTGDTDVEVTGLALDDDPVSVTVNGEPVTVDSMGRFTATVALSFGVNHINVEASDDVFAPTSSQMSVLWAPSYVPTADENGTPRLSYEDGLTVSQHSTFFDDGVADDTSTLPVTIDAVSDVAEVALHAMDVASLIADPVVDNPPTLVLRFTDWAMGSIAVTAQVTAVGVDVSVRIGQIDVPTAGSVNVAATALDLTGSVSGAATTTISLETRRADNDGPVEVSLIGTPTVILDSMQSNFVDVEANAVFQLKTGPLRTSIEQEMSQVIVDALGVAVTGVVLIALDTAPSHAVTVDQSPLPSTTLQLDGVVSLLSPQVDAGILTNVRTGLGSATQTTFPMSMGAPQIDDGASAAQFQTSADSIQIALRQSLANGILHMAWNGGLLDFDASSLIPSGLASIVSDVRVHGALTPVIVPAPAASAYPLVIQLGQLEVQLSYDGISERHGVAVSAGVDIHVDGAAVRLVPRTELVNLRVWRIESESEDLLNPADQDVQELVRAGLWPQLRAAFETALTLQLPLPDLSGLAGVVPDFFGLSFTAGASPAISVADGFVFIDATPTAEIPAP